MSGQPLAPTNLVRDPRPFTVRWPHHEWICGMPHCGADHMTRSEYRTHMACTHDRVIRKPMPLAVRV